MATLDWSLIAIIVWCGIMFIIVMVRFTCTWYKTNKRLLSQGNNTNRPPHAERTLSLPQSGRRNQHTQSLEDYPNANDEPPTYEELLNAEKQTEKYEFPVEV